MTLTLAARRKVVWALVTVVAGWIASAVFVVLFQCGVSEPWFYVRRSCIDRVSDPPVPKKERMAC